MRVDLERGFKALACAVEVAALKEITACPYDRGGVFGIMIDVRAIFVVGIVEAANLAQLLGEAKPRFIQVGSRSRAAR